MPLGGSNNKKYFKDIIFVKNLFSGDLVSSALYSLMSVLHKDVLFHIKLTRLNFSHSHPCPVFVGKANGIHLKRHS